MLRIETVVVQRKTQYSMCCVSDSIDGTAVLGTHSNIQAASHTDKYYVPVTVKPTVCSNYWRTYSLLQLLSNLKSAPITVKPTVCSNYCRTYSLLQLLSKLHSAPITVEPISCSSYCTHNYLYNSHIDARTAVLHIPDDKKF
jgi:hypothetical protein